MMCRDKLEVQQSTWFTYFSLDPRSGLNGSATQEWTFGDMILPNSLLFEPHDALGRASTIPPVSFPLQCRAQKERKTGSESCSETVVTFSGAYRWTLVETPLENERFVACSGFHVARPWDRS